MNVEDIRGAVEKASRRKAPPGAHPKGWEPGLTVMGGEAEVVGTGDDPDLAVILAGSDLNSDEWEQVGEVQFRKWQQRPGGEWLRYYRVRLVRRTKRSDDLSDLISAVSKWRPPKARKAPHGGTRVVCASDWQLGKDEGHGVQGTVDHWLAAIPQMTALLRKERPETLVFANLGDLIENCDGHFAMQTFRTTLDLREQMRLARWMTMQALKAWAPHVDRVVCPAVPGNHGEVRKNGKAFTTFSDNYDLAIWEGVAEAVTEGPWDHITFIEPRTDDLTLTLDIEGQIVGFAHGHQMRRGGALPQQKFLSWFDGQARGRTPIADCDIVVSAHYHHLQVAHFGGGRTWMQSPSIEGGSAWFRQATGESSPPGVLTFAVDADGWSRLRLL